MDTLWQICETIYFPRRLNIGPETRRQYRYALNDWGRCLGHDPSEGDLTDDALLIWIRRLLDRQPPLSAWTINERVGRVRTLWGWLARRGRLTTFPTVTRIPAPEPSPRAWTQEQLAALFAAADLEGGKIDVVPARLWWRARLAFHWFTGERKGAVDALRMDWCDLTRGKCWIPAQVRKGRRKPGNYDLPPPLVVCLLDIWQPPRDLVFPWDRSADVYWLRWNRLLRNACLPGGSKRKTQALRISHASWRHKLGDDPTKALLHSDPATTRRHYLDPSLTDDERAKLFIPWRSAEGRE